jgi:hypothetical protein
MMGVGEREFEKCKRSAISRVGAVANQPVARVVLQSPSEPATGSHRPRLRLRDFRERLIATSRAYGITDPELSSPYLLRTSDSAYSYIPRAQ